MIAEWGERKQHFSMQQGMCFIVNAVINYNAFLGNE